MGAACPRDPIQAGTICEGVRGVRCNGGVRSKRVMRDGQPGVVRDLRVEGTESVVLRLAPVGAVDSFDLSASWHGETVR